MSTTGTGANLNSRDAPNSNQPLAEPPTTEPQPLQTLRRDPPKPPMTHPTSSHSHMLSTPSQSGPTPSPSPCSNRMCSSLASSAAAVPLQVLVARRMLDLGRGGVEGSGAGLTERMGDACRETGERCCIACVTCCCMQSCSTQRDTPLSATPHLNQTKPIHRPRARHELMATHLVMVP